MSELEVRPYAPELAGEVAAVFNQASASWPYCSRLDADFFAAQIVPRFFFESEGLLLAFRAGRAIGYIHASGTPSADRQTVRYDVGSVSALFAPPDEPATAAALLAAAE